MRATRRGLLGMWGLGLASVLAGCDQGPAPRPEPTPTPAPGPTPLHVARSRPHRTVAPERATVVYGLPAGSRDVALTIDDGYDPETVAAYVEFAARTRTPLTFNPNGRYSYAWAPHATILRPLIEAGQVQIGNHTFDHTNLLQATDAKVRDEIELNEEWIEHTFRTTSRPWFRPPYGFRDARTDEIAASLGFSRILMWNGSFGDSRLLTPQQLLREAYRYLNAGTIVLGHANHPTVTHLFDAISELITERALTPTTLNEAFKLSRRQNRDTTVRERPTPTSPPTAR